MKRGKCGAVALFFLLMACGNAEEQETSEQTDIGENENDVEEEPDTEEEPLDPVEELSAEYDIELEPLEIEPYGEEVGLTIDEPVYQEFAAETSFTLEGSIEDRGSLNSDHLWITMITGNEDDTEFGEDSFDYYVPIEEDGSFSEEIVFHSGEFNHQLTVRIPSNEDGEEDLFYDAVRADIQNASDEIAREIQFTQLAHEYDLSMNEPAEGYMEVENSLPLSGTIPGANDGEFVFIQVEGEDDQAEFSIPIENEQFTTEVPLSFGEGIHRINVMLYVEEEELYYDGAHMVAHAASSDELVQVEQYEEYFEQGITLKEPTNTNAFTYEGNEYRIAGEIDPSAEGADEITHMIVTTELEDETANYYLPVEDYAFDDTIWFRFGEGEYDITVSVPEPREEGADYFQFFGVATFSHEVVGAEDLRSLLPSVGIESDDPRIEEVAEEVTAGLSDEREKAEAVYEYVAQNIRYDVQKQEDNLFEMDDSALKTLETGEGVCQDYAFLAIAMLRALGMEANYVAGNVGAERHAWVDVMVDGDWLEMDPTWGAGYVVDGEFVAEYNKDYFDPDEDFLNETHARTEIIY